MNNFEMKQHKKKWSETGLQVSLAPLNVSVSDSYSLSAIAAKAAASGPSENAAGLPASPPSSTDM